MQMRYNTLYSAFNIPDNIVWYMWGLFWI